MILGLLFPDQKCLPYSVESLDTINSKEMPGEIEHLFGENKQILGWVHTHTRGVNCFFSSLDVHTQFTYQQMCSDFLGIVCELSEDNFFINQDYYNLTDEGMTNVLNCIAINNNKTLNHQHNFCNSELKKFELYQSIKDQNVVLVDHNVIIHVAAQFERFEKSTFNHGPSLQTHIETVHEKRKPKEFVSPKMRCKNDFSCQICDGKFTNEPSLKTHI